MRLSIGKLKECKTKSRRHDVSGDDAGQCKHIKAFRGVWAVKRSLADTLGSGFSAQESPRQSR